MIDLQYPRFSMTSSNPKIKGWRYLWCKSVTAFNPRVHCARCLIGSYENLFGMLSPVNQNVDLITRKPGDILYFCGVALPYKWANNMHMAVRVTNRSENIAIVKCHNGDLLTVEGAVVIPFDDAIAKAQYPTLDKSFLTCRNFQFGAQMREVGRLPVHP